MPSKRKLKIKLPTLKQIHEALPVVSAGLGVLSVLPFKNKQVRKSLAAAAAVTATAGAAKMPAKPTAVSAKEKLLAVLAEFDAATPETPADKITELTASIIALARQLTEEDE